MAAVRLHAGPDALGEAVAARLHAEIAEAVGPGRRFLLGCPGGRSPRPVYQSLGRVFARCPLDLSRLVIVMMDEYLVGPDEAPIACDPAVHFSCRGFAQREIVAVLNAGLDAHLRMSGEQVWLPDPAHPEVYDERIADAGGIDHFLLASGAGDGHVAFNPPGTPAESRTRVVTLAETTRRDNVATFPEFGSVDAVPRKGVSVGIATIAGLSRAATMLLWGEGKREAFRRITQAAGYDPSWPATVVAACRNGVVEADHAAASLPAGGPA